MTLMWVMGILGGLLLIMTPLVACRYLDQALWFNRIVWWIRERDFPTPQPTWTVQDLHRHAVKELHILWDTDPRWPSYDERVFLQRLIDHLETRPNNASLTPREIGDWLAIRDLRGA